MISYKTTSPPSCYIFSPLCFVFLHNALPTSNRLYIWFLFIYNFPQWWALCLFCSLLCSPYMSNIVALVTWSYLNLNKLNLRIQFLSCTSLMLSAHWPHLTSVSIVDSTDIEYFKHRKFNGQHWSKISWEQR